MPTVSAIRATKRGRVAVYVDGSHVFSVGEATVARWRLYTGRVLTEAELEELSAEGELERALADAYRLLSHRARATAELRARLRQKEHGEATVEAALERLTAAGLLDDLAFARAYTGAKRSESGWGEYRIRRGLAQLGVGEDLIDCVLGELFGEGYEPTEEAFRLLCRRGTPAPPQEAAQRRAYHFLLRRGFPAAVAYAAVRRWMAGEPSSD